jgi:hypothetical protein
VISPAVGEPTNVATSLANAGDPVWLPVGRSLLIFGRKATSGKETDPDLLVGAARREGDRAVARYARVHAHGLAIDVPDTHPYPFPWTSDGVLFSCDGCLVDLHQTSDNIYLTTIESR